MQKKKKKAGKPTPPRLTTVRYICLGCDKQEEIPYQVVRDFDKQDYTRDLSLPPMFTCESCGKAMYPRYYNGFHGFEYRISNVLDTKRPR